MSRRSVRALAATLGLLLAPSLAGCRATDNLVRKLDPLADVRKRVGEPISEIAHDKRPDGSVILYQYVDGFGERCNIGLVHVGGLHTEKPTLCGKGPVLELLASQAVEGSEGRPETIFLGAVRDARVTKVTVTLKGREPLTATVHGAIWYVLLDEAIFSPAIERVEGQDEQGTVLVTQNYNSRPGGAKERERD